MYSPLQDGSFEPGVAVAAAPLPEDTASSVARRPTSLSLLKSAIARAMQVAADRERKRIDAGVGEEETAQVEKIYGRAAAEAAELSKEADEDVSLVNTWFEAQVQRIRRDADRQIDDRRTGLEQALLQHGSLIEAEIESVHVAVQVYRGSLGAFFGQLAEEQDPGGIARLAGTLPDPPDLDQVRADARSGAMLALERGSATQAPDPTDDDSANGDGGTGAEREPVAVMDPDAVAPRVESLIGTPVSVAAAPVEVASTHGNVAVRVIRALTSWTSPTGVPEDR